jgi:hypothetical protein
MMVTVYNTTPCIATVTVYKTSCHDDGKSTTLHHVIVMTAVYNHTPCRNPENYK